MAQKNVTDRRQTPPKSRANAKPSLLTLGLEARAWAHVEQQMTSSEQEQLKQEPGAPAPALGDMIVVWEGRPGRGSGQTGGLVRGEAGRQAGGK